MARWTLLIAIVMASLAPASAGATQVVNGGFETGDFTGWSVRGFTGAGKWFTYEGTKPPIDHQRGAVAVQPPPQGNSAAITDQLNPETLLLYQDLQLEPGSAYRLGLLAYYDSYSALTTPPSGTLSVDPEAGGADPNQQLRIDVMKPTAALDSVAPEDVLLNLFQTRSGGARTMGPTRFVGDLAPFAGQTVRLRIAVVATEEVLSAGVDAVTLSTADGTFPQSKRRIRPRKPRADRRTGTVLLPVQVPEAGRLVATSRGGKIKRTSARAATASVLKLRLRPGKGALAALERRHKLRVGVTLTWRPLTGNVQRLRVPVVLKLRET